MPEAIADASTLINLAAIGRLDLLRVFHSQVFVSPAVWREVVTEGGGRPGAEEVKRAREEGWVEVRQPSNVELVKALSMSLDDGEAEAIALAVERKSPLIFLDESDARRVAEVHGLAKSGVIGILLRAKIDGRIASLKAELDKLRRIAGFWIHDSLYDAMLRETGESE